MNKKFILALMLTTGMAFAQTGSSGSTPDQSSQQPSTTSPSTSPTTPSTSPSTTDQTNSTQTNSTTSSTTSTSDQSNSMRGCLKQSGGNWVLASDNGQTINLQGDSSMLKPHDGHQVQVQGTRASDGSLQVSSVNMISDSCTNNQASGPGAPLVLLLLINRPQAHQLRLQPRPAPHHQLPPVRLTRVRLRLPLRPAIARQPRQAAPRLLRPIPQTPMLRQQPPTQLRLPLRVKAPALQ